MNKEPATSQNEPFIDRVLKLCQGEHNNRRTRAELRRYWSPATRHYAYPVLARLVALPRETSVLTAETVIAVLYAYNPNHQPDGLRLGQAALRLSGGSMKSERFEAFEHHFRRLLACDGGGLNELSQQLRRILIRMERESIPLNYNQLLWDVRKWRQSSDDVKAAWARDFWRAPTALELQPYHVSL